MADVTPITVEELRTECAALEEMVKLPAWQYFADILEDQIFTLKRAIMSIEVLNEAVQLFEGNRYD